MAASEPTAPLSQTTDILYPLTLNQQFGTLTRVRAVPLSLAKFTPDEPSPAVYNVKTFGVGQGTDPFRGQLPQSVALQL